MCIASLLRSVRVQGDSRVQAVGLVVQEKDRMESMNGKQLQSFLGRIVLAGQDYARDSQPLLFMSLATDKSHVGGLPLQSTYVSINGANVLIQCLPQVAFRQ